MQRNKKIKYKGCFLIILNWLTSIKYKRSRMLVLNPLKNFNTWKFSCLKHECRDQPLVVWNNILLSPSEERQILVPQASLLSLDCAIFFLIFCTFHKWTFVKWKHCYMYDVHTSHWKQNRAVTALTPFKHLLQVASYLKLYCVPTFSPNNDSEIQFISVQLNVGTFIFCEDFRKCRRHRWLYSACHSSLELKDESTTKRTF